MSAVPNALRRAGTYHFRRTVPMCLRKALGRVELVRSLRTHDPVLARSRTRRLYLYSEALFGLVRGVPMLDDCQISALVQRFFDTELEEENAVRLGTGVRFDEANRQAAVAYFERLGVGVAHALARNELEQADNWVNALLERELPDLQLDPTSRAKLQQGVLRASCELTTALRKRFEGDFHHEPDDPILRARPDKATSFQSEPKATNTPAAVPGPLFSIRAEEFRLKRLRLGTWDKQTALQARKTYALWVEVCGDRPVGGFVRQDAVRFKGLLVELPANYGKAARFRGMPVTDIVEMTRESAFLRLTPRTVQRHLSALACLWGEAIEAGEVETQIFGNFKLPTAKRAKDQRDMWSNEQLKRLFDTPVWRGCFSQARRSKPGAVIVRDEKFWLPLIAVYSGMRQEEICQLHCEDIRQHEGVWVFDVHDAPPRQLKNRNARRLVPLHHKLIEVGLLDYVDELRREGSSRIFPNLKPGGADDRFGHNFAKWFTRYRRDVGLYEPLLDFHSLRHSATTFLIQAGVEPILVDALTGHETAGETARYTKQFKIEQLRAAIDQLNPELDLSHLAHEGM